MIKQLIENLNKEHNLEGHSFDSVLITQKNCEVLVKYNIEELQIIKKKLNNLALDLATKDNQYAITLEQYKEILKNMPETSRDQIKDELINNLQSHIFSNISSTENVELFSLNTDRLESFLESISALELMNFMNSKAESIVQDDKIIYRKELESVLKRSLHTNKLENIFKLYLNKGNGYWRACFYIDEKISVSSYEDFNSLYNSSKAYQHLVSYLIVTKTEYEKYLSQDECLTLYNQYFYHVDEIEKLLQKPHSQAISRKNSKDEDYQVIKSYLNKYKLQENLNRSLTKNKEVKNNVKI